MSLAETHITIAGLGLMGGSLALALRQKCAGVTAVDSDQTTLAFARRNKLVDFATGDFTEGVARADLLVLATPVRTILAQIAQLAELSISQSSLAILDLGSTKHQICAAMAALPDHFDPIGGHPMCGKETPGIDNATSHMYATATFVLSPLECTTPATLGLAEELVKAIGARSLLLAPAEHDELVAITSHLPYLVSSSLMALAVENANGDENLWSVTASGFRDTTRLAASDTRMMADIIETNRSAILAALRGEQALLARMEALLEEGDTGSLRNWLAEIRKERMERV